MYFIKHNLFTVPAISIPSQSFYKNYRIQDLPVSYLNLLDEQNGGYLAFNLVPTTEPTRDGLDSVGIHYLFGLHEDFGTSILFQEHYHKTFSLPEYLIFFSVNDDQLWAFDYSNVTNGEPSIRYIDMDTDQWLTIADNFATFLDLLQVAPPDINEEKILSRLEANHSFLLGSDDDISQLLTRFETEPDKVWYFNWLAELLTHKNQDVQQSVFSAFETQVLYFNPVLPPTSLTIANSFKKLDPNLIDQERLAILLKEL